jgi:hypothetical protein
MKSILLILVKVCLGSFDRVQSLDEVVAHGATSYMLKGVPLQMYRDHWAHLNNAYYRSTFSFEVMLCSSGKVETEKHLFHFRM